MLGKEESLMIFTASLTFLNGARILKTVSEYHILIEHLKLLVVFSIFNSLTSGRF